MRLQPPTPTPPHPKSSLCKTPQIHPRKCHSSLSLKIAWLPWWGQTPGLQREKHKHNSCQTRLSTLQSACSDVHTQFSEQEESSVKGVAADRGYARHPAPVLKTLHVQKFKLIITLPNKSELCLSVILARIFSRLPKTRAYPNTKTM